jgi:ATP-dependent protease HslVU (ClpYQ) peptidase subunit
MTCIVAVRDGDGIVMGGDSAAVGDSHYITLTARPKVFKSGPVMIGYTSSFAMGQALEFRLKLPPLKDDLDRWMVVEFIDACRKAMREVGFLKIDSHREEGGTFIAVVQNEIYEINEDFQARRILGDVCAVGSGISVAQGAAYAALRCGRSAKDAVKMALEAAQTFVTTVREPFHYVQNTSGWTVGPIRV